jgi:hypothetical protein
MERNRANHGSGNRWLPLAGVAAIVGSILWMATPWVQTAVLGDRPYVASAFDVASFASWTLMLVGLIGYHRAFRNEHGRMGRLGVGLAGIGMVLVALLELRSVSTFVDAGFRSVPATGEDPAGLVVTLGLVLGLGCTVVGAGVIGVAVRRGGTAATMGAFLLLSAPAVPLFLVVLRFLSVLPLPVGRLVVSTNAALLPLGLGWLALGRLVLVHSKRADEQVSATPD